jgi:DNA-binding CsgD family transcriptional regulator
MAPTIRDMLVGREHERKMLGELLAGARAGRSGVFALVGEAGIGKTALLDDTAERARAEGMAVLRARGIQSETKIPFATLFELLRPILSALGQIPRPQAEALESALALRPAKAHDRFAVGAATLSLLAARAEEQPLAVLIDDAHWLDDASADALLFAARRLMADPVAFVVAAREGEASLLQRADLPTYVVTGLDSESAATLLGRGRGDELAGRLHRETGGNPLALLELSSPHALPDAFPPGAPVAVAVSVAEAFVERLGGLPERTQLALLLASAAYVPDLAFLARAAVPLAVDVADLAPAEAADLLTIANGALEFRHPLVRSAVYGAAPPERRRAVHRALADALPDAEADRRAWHLALAAVGPDEAASSALEQAGARAQERSAYAVAASAFERAARLALDEERRARLLYAAADAAWLGGLHERAAPLLDEARRTPHEQSLDVPLDHLRGRIATSRGPVMEGHAILLATAERAAAADPERAALMLAEASGAAFVAGEAAAMQEAATLAERLDGRRVRTAFFGRLLRGMALIFSGQGAPGADAIRSAVEELEAAGGLWDDPRLLQWVAMGPLWLRDAATGRELVEHVLGAAREASALGMLPGLLLHVGIDHAGGGRWNEARSTFHEAMRLAREAGQRTEQAGALARLAWLAARRGDEEECTAHAREALELAAPVGAGLYEIWTRAALADLELALGRSSRALERLEQQRRVLETHAIADPDLSPAPEMVEVLLRLRREADAAAEAEAYTAAAAAKGQPWALARAARARGLLAQAKDADTTFEEALALHERTPDIFETARTLLAYGSRLRRAQRRVEARERLRNAIALFDRLGATAWTKTAQTELAATGETARRRDPSTLGELTPQEFQIAQLLAEGATTKEAAAALFLSPKTIEYHLRNAYRKLGVNSRRNLAQVLGARDSS